MHSILLVDDDVDSLSALKFVFEVHDFKVFLAKNGGIALAHAATHRPDLVVTDMEMPELDGIELCKRLRHHPTLRDVPVILVSGAVPPTDAPVLWDAFLPKPVDCYQLIAVIEQLPLFRLGGDERNPGERCSGDDVSAVERF
ncbi:two component transcriptional regulator [Caballeronia catudaia]|uniref:Two component transcriptional regulator n=1 Tax=Caballeronia catudaia TaxID=1777136 RepID=A0A158DII9_9BURK|nr:response regulator [Caballeronia catudaia]SAK94429.1 two component transcriptional regulator [Caballeronia catudaia]